MQDPSSPPAIRHSCPSCNRPVEPGYKFCEACGTRIPALLTCSRCGTQFTAPGDFCDLCHAPLILVKDAEPYEANSPDEEDAGQADDGAPERDDGDIPWPAEPQEDTALKKPVPAGTPSPHRPRVEIQEPDTEELLEKYGSEYDASETVSSFYRSKSRSAVKRIADKPSGPARTGRGSPGSVDEALFLSPGGQGEPVKRRANRAAVTGAIIVTAAVIAAVYFIGLPFLAGTGDSGTGTDRIAEEAPGGSGPAVNGTTPPLTAATAAAAPGGLVTLPTETIPSVNKLYFQVQKSPVTSRILITFAGSAGQGSIRSADIKVTHPDGSVATGIILPLKGITEIILDGSEDASDRVEIIAQMSDGGTYRVYDTLVP